ncbi:TraR/DksA family transcriptional regulator [Silvibacterium acidisoli]|uniref:TraR/DksA family transcriptional regulator n=1 Tax=Acidobacteriaceae bacterium ZG23-2 TaxID=2883246 RepID=UPI00406CC096
MSLSAQSLKHFQEKLLEQKRQLQQTMSATVEQGRATFTEETQDVADQAVSSYQREMLFSQGSKGHAQLRSVGQALQRIEDGSFGECTHCGNEIGAKRLEAMPSTPYCIDCQEKRERGELEDPSRAA